MHIPKFILLLTIAVSTTAYPLPAASSPIAAELVPRQPLSDIARSIPHSDSVETPSDDTDIDLLLLRSLPKRRYRIEAPGSVPTLEAQNELRNKRSTEYNGVSLRSGGKEEFQELKRGFLDKLKELGESMRDSVEDAHDWLKEKIDKVCSALDR